MLSGGFADRNNTSRLASVEFCAFGAKLCAQSRCILFVKKPLLFDSSYRARTPRKARMHMTTVMPVKTVKILTSLQPPISK